MSNTTITYTGNGSRTAFDITFPFLSESDLKTSLGDVTKTLAVDYTVSGSVLTFNSAPGNGVTIKIWRVTNIDNPKHDYSSGSSITASSLNDNQKQVLFALKEVPATTSGDISTGNHGDIHVSQVNGDWEIRDNKVTKAKMADNSVGTAEIETNAVTHVELKDDASTDGNRAVTTNHIRDNAITMAKLGSGALPTDITVDHGNIVADAIRTAEIKDSEITLAKLAAAVANSLVPVGTIIYFAGLYPPIGYIKANGDNINSTTTTFTGSDYKQVNADYTGIVDIGTIDTSRLYKVVGNILPDLQGQFVRGYRGVNNNIDNSGTTAHVSSGGLWSSSYGTDTVLRIQSDDFKTHQHEFGSDDQVRSQGGYTSLGSFSYDANSDTSGSGQRARTKDDNTNSGGTETRPMNIALLACIKY